MMTRKPDDVKKGLECRLRSYKDVCDHQCDTCDLRIPAYSIFERYEDALVLIQQLESDVHFHKVAAAPNNRVIAEQNAIIFKLQAENAELSGKIGQLEANNKLLQDAVDQWEFVAASPGAVEDMARENAELLKKVEQLQAERDAAVADMRQASIYLCCACKKYHHAVRGVSNHYCEVIGERADFTGAISCGMFEWRGVPKEDGNASD